MPSGLLHSVQALLRYKMKHLLIKRQPNTRKNTNVKKKQLSIKQLITCYSARLSMWTPHVHTSREPRIVLLFDLAPGQNTTLLDIFSKVVWVSQACPLRYTFMIYPSSKLHTHCPCSNCEGTQMPYHFWGDSN